MTKRTFSEIEIEDLKTANQELVYALQKMRDTVHVLYCYIRMPENDDNQYRRKKLRKTFSTYLARMGDSVDNYQDSLKDLNLLDQGYSEDERDAWEDLKEQKLDNDPEFNTQLQQMKEDNRTIFSKEVKKETVEMLEEMAKDLVKE